MNSRRLFIKKSGLFVLAGSLPLSHFLPKEKKKLGVALVGLGYYSRDLLAPALQLTQYCELRGIVTGSPEKIPVWQKKYKIPDGNVYNYENMHTIAQNPDIDVVYIVLPPGLHNKYTLVGAGAGKHVWCEKPMAPSVQDCKEMIDTCQKNKVQLAIGYRMHHEPVTQTIIGWHKTKPYGNIRTVVAEAGYYNGASDPSHWKLHKKLGGGAMMDMGVYPLNAARYATGLEPVAVSAKTEYTRPDLFEADETTIFKLEFPQGIIANCKTSFAESINTLKVNCEKGWYQLRPFQAYSGVTGTTSDKQNLYAFSGNQQARQMDDDALSIINKQPPLVPGEEGMRDIKVVEAIFKSAADAGQRVEI